MNVYHLYGDDGGETHLTRVDLQLVEHGQGAGRVRALGAIPAKEMSIAELIDRLPDERYSGEGFHAAPERQFLIILRGEYEITTTSGDRQRVKAGECLFADDLNSRGHISRDVGKDPLTMVRVAVPAEWQLVTHKA